MCKAHYQNRNVESVPAAAFGPTRAIEENHEGIAVLAVRTARAAGQTCLVFPHVPLRRLVALPSHRAVVAVAVAVAAAAVVAAVAEASVEYLEEDSAVLCLASPSSVARRMYPGNPGMAMPMDPSDLYP